MPLAAIGCSDVRSPSSKPVDPAEIAPSDAQAGGESAPTNGGAATGTGRKKSAPAAAEASKTETKAASNADPAPAPPRGSGNAEVQKQPKVATPVPEPPEYTYEPKVVMSEAHAATCLVGVGDPMPSFALPGLQGDVHHLKKLLGEKLTVVVLWSNEHRLGREQVSRLNRETALPFQDASVQVIAINVGDRPEQIGDLLPAKEERAFKVLLDESGDFFNNVATKILPRTYVLDSDGRIQWFDIEYSRSSRRDLRNAIHVFLGDRKPAES